MKYAQALHHAAGVLQGPCGLEEIEKFQNYLQEFQIVIVSADHGFHTIFPGPSASKVLGVLKAGTHFHSLTSLKGFFVRDAFCVHCGKSYKTGGKTKRPHNFRGTVSVACMQHHCPNAASRQQVLCYGCGRFVKGPTCLMAHRTKTVNGKEASSSDKPSICRAYKKCQSCKKQVTGKEVKYHKCLHSKCPSCKQCVDLKNHKCFIQVIKEETEDVSSSGEQEEQEEELSEGEVSSTEEQGIEEAEELSEGEVSSTEEQERSPVQKTKE